MKRVIVTIALVITSLSVVGCTTQTNKNEDTNQQVIKVNDTAAIEGYKVQESRVTEDGLLQKVVLSKKFTQAELENAVKSQKFENGKMTIDFYNNEDEIKQNKAYTVAQIVVKDGAITYQEAAK